MTILTEAHKLVHGVRGKTYSHPFEDFSRTAKIWSAILGVEVTPEQAVLCMIGVKMSRLCATPGHHDSLVDIPGYAECFDMIRERRDELEAE
jgi:hypothetical protein